MHRYCAYSMLSTSPLRIQGIHFITNAYTGCLMHRHCVYRMFSVSSLRIQRVQYVAIAHTNCSVHRHCVYRVLIVSPVRIQSVQYIASAYTGCSMYRPALLRVLLYSFFINGARWNGWLTPRSGRFPLRNNSVPTVQEAGWDPRPVCTVRNISSPSGFDFRTVKHVASRYTDWAIPAPRLSYTCYYSALLSFTLHPSVFITLFSHCSFICVFWLSFLFLWSSPIADSFCFSFQPPLSFNLLSQTPSIHQFTSFNLSSCTSPECPFLSLSYSSSSI
jgi:hypothetical protein